MGEKSGDQQSRAELLGELLLAVKEQAYLVRYGSGRDVTFFVLVPVDESEASEVGAARAKPVTVVRLGRLALLPLPLETGLLPGEIPEAYYSVEKGRWTGTIALMRYR